MTIVRGVKDRRFKFTQLLNSAVEDENLSLKAKGFIWYALSKPEHWIFHISHLVKSLKEGEDAIYSTIKELELQGYALRYRKRKDDGSFANMETVVSDSKEEITLLKKELMDNPNFKKCLPHRGFPDVDVPVLENPDTSNTNSVVIQEQQQQQEPKKSNITSIIRTQPTPLSSAAAVFSKNQRGESSKSKEIIYPCLIPIDIPEVDKIEISKRFHEETVKNAIVWALHPQTKLTKGLSPALKWACMNKPKMPEKAKEKEKDKPGIDYAPFNKTYYRHIFEIASKNGVYLNAYGFRQSNEYVETEKDRLYFKDSSFLEQLANIFRKKDINKPAIVKCITVCQEDLMMQ